MNRNSILTANFLQNAALALPSNNKSLDLLKSYYLTQMYKLGSIHLDKNQDDKSKCRKCLTTLRHGNYNMKILPRKVHRKHLKKLVESHEKNELLSKSKKTMARKYQKLIYNTMIIKCSICDYKYKTLIRQKKKAKLEQKKLQQNDDVKIVDESKQSQQNPNKSRKRKKDKFAGLNTEIILKHQKTNNAQLSKPNNCNEKSKQISSNNLKKEKRRLKTTSMIQTEKNVAAKKQKNNLLQLVNVLKKQQNQISNNNCGLTIEHLFKREN